MMAQLTAAEPFPENRYGESVAWSRWYRGRTMPDTEHKCCLCGEVGMSPGETAVDALTSILISLPELITENGDMPDQDLYRLVETQIKKSTGTLLLPYAPELDNRKDAEQIVRYFKDSPLKVCIPCLGASGRAVETIVDLIKKSRKKKKLPSKALARRRR